MLILLKSIKAVSSLGKIFIDSDVSYLTELKHFSMLKNEKKTIQIALDIIEGMKVRVPRAESKDKDELREKFLKYKETIGEVIDSMMTSSYLDDVVTELGISKENIVGNIKLITLVDWCEEHNYARGLVKLIDMTDKVDLK